MAGARSADVKSGRSAERQWKNGPERGALETPGRAPRITGGELVNPNSEEIVGLLL